MSKADVLIISPFFSPELISTGKYNTCLAKGLVDSGALVDVLCSCALYPDWKPECIDTKILGIKAIRGGWFMRYPSSPLLRRMLLEIWFVTFVFRQTIFNRKKYDVLVLVYPPNLVSVLIPLIKTRGTKVVGIVHDIQGVMANLNNSRVRSLLMGLIHRVERYSYKACDALVFLSDGMKQVAQDLYSISDDCSVVRYPFVTMRQYQDETELDAIFTGKENTIVYSGALGEKQAPDNLIALLLAVLKKNKNLNAMIFSQGKVFDRLRSNYQHDRLHFHPLVSEEHLPELIARSSVQIIPQAVQMSEGAFPSKLPNLLAGGAKVFAISAKSGELANVLDGYSNASVCFSWEGMDKLAQDLIDFVELPPKEINQSDRKLLARFSLSHLVEYILPDSELGKRRI